MRSIEGSLELLERKNAAARDAPSCGLEVSSCSSGRVSFWFTFQDSLRGDLRANRDPYLFASHYCYPNSPLPNSHYVFGRKAELRRAEPRSDRREQGQGQFPADSRVACSAYPRSSPDHLPVEVISRPSGSPNYPGKSQKLERLCTPEACRRLAVTRHPRPGND